MSNLCFRALISRGWAAEWRLSHWRLGKGAGHLLVATLGQGANHIGSGVLIHGTWRKRTAWSQVKSIDPTKLTEAEGYKVLLGALSTWEESAELQTYDLFEKAFYKTLQKQDETTMSYVNRINVAFTEVGEDTTVKQVKAFVLLRQSGLSAEDKKRVIAMADGYDPTKMENAMRALSTKVLSQGEVSRKKIYPINYVDEDAEEINQLHDDEPDEESVMAALLEEGDESAMVVQEFEENIIQVCQDSPELAMAFSAYQDARARLRDKARNRGFWPLRQGGKAKGKSKNGTGKGFGKNRQTLAERIANSNCRICGMRGHWRQECPQRDRQSPAADANLLVEENGNSDTELVSQLPTNVEISMWQACLPLFLKAIKNWFVGRSRNNKGLFTVALTELIEAASEIEGRFTVHFSSSKSRHQQLKWLNLNLNEIPISAIRLTCPSVCLHMALPKEMFLNKGEVTYAMNVGPNLEMPLTAKEDPSLSFDQGPIVQHRRPPGVTNLQQWGEMKLPEGKWKGHSFAEAYLRDNKYVSFMASHSRLTSAWALSFHQYARLRLQAEVDHRDKMLKIEQEKEHHLRQLVATATTGALQPCHREWELLSTPKSVDPEVKSQSSHGPMKRSAIEVEEQMDMQFDLEKETKEDKMVRLAILQREVDKIQQVILEEKPKEIWVAPDCKYWGNYSRRNMGMKVRRIEVCRGTERLRVPDPSVDQSEIPLRVTVVKDRSSGQAQVLGPPQTVYLDPAAEYRMAIAKHKEIGAWLKHSTVRKVAKGKIPEASIMRCRWILSWKSASPADHPNDVSNGQKGKARLVVVGFEDPGIGVVQNDSPTLSKDGRQMIVQQVSSHGWDLISFDISTAFLHGEGDGRLLGIHPPPELAEALGMAEGDQCQLMGGAYGRVDAPYLWFCKFRDTLLSEGFKQCPMDPCVFTLTSKDSSGKIIVHGSIGVHVDDGIGGGDSKFMDALNRIRKHFNFGSFEKGSFTFTGIRFKQWDDKSVEYDQIEYIERIQPLEIPRHRRTQLNSQITAEETTQLRSLVGALQYAAVHARPDLAAKIGELQACVPKATVQDLIGANKVLHEAKVNQVTIMAVPIAPSLVSFCAFSDASFLSGKEKYAHQGGLVFATTPELLENRKAVVAPVAWISKKIHRVTRSTLGAEAIALSGAVDRLLWIRLLWEWLNNPEVDWRSPEEALCKARRASLVTDCKSAYDLLTRTALPQCEEHRTTIECLLIRERLQSNCTVRWVTSNAQLADCLTKSMDSTVLRECLRSGKYALYDEGRILQQRSDKKQRLKWAKEVTSEINEVPTNSVVPLEDAWEVNSQGQVIRIHHVPRRRLFSPIGVAGCPVDIRELGVQRVTIGNASNGEQWNEKDFWPGSRGHAVTPFSWTGRTIFQIKGSVKSTQFPGPTVN
ncbi:unnamed protein product [Cladocopium goreaui]|uniref:Retrovirus-related Pol polyprotein from transposon RE1 (Retro element 1) (AtRE1) n=1 Tax=Cladocopium goreaui TaxID=2562237 RepID=A0A9P1CS73_9DINO|nr:unnamed protein product [Cladocopium goreaui]